MSTENRCVKCGRETPGRAAFCPTCKTCLLVDVVVDASDLDRRAIYLAARDIDTINGPAPTFEEAKARLEGTPGLIAPECTRALAQVIAGILTRHDIPSRFVELRRPRRRIVPIEGLQRSLRSFFKPGITLVQELSPNARIAIAGLLIVAGLALVMSRDQHVELSQQISHRGDGDHQAAMSTREIVFAAIGSSAKVSTSQSSGIGFFVSPELLVTSARIAGSAKKTTEIIFPDGKRLQGVVEKSDEWLDLALVRIAGANAPFLELGDATLLERGETIMAVSNPRALEFTASQGIINHTSWVDLGVSYLMIDADFATSGGPVLDRFARVVGIVTSDMAARSDLRLAIPVNYLRTGKQALFPGLNDNDAAKRWQKVITNALKEEEVQLEEARSNNSYPSLIKASLIDSDTIEIVLARFAPNTPQREELHFEFVSGAQNLCTTSATVTEWRATSPNTKEISQNRLLQWFDHHHLSGKFYSAKSHLMPFGCPDNLLGTTLVLSSADPRADRVIIAR